MTTASTSPRATRVPRPEPPEKSEWCVYAKRWIGIKHYWTLLVTGAERSALKQMLGTWA